MHPDKSSFPRSWWATTLPDARLKKVRPYLGTYGKYPYDNLPPAPRDLRGDFKWLLEAPAIAECHVGHEYTPQKLAEVSDSYSPNARR